MEQRNGNVNLNDLSVTLDVHLLTFPEDALSTLRQNNSAGMRTTSFCSTSSQQTFNNEYREEETLTCISSPGEEAQ